MREAYESEGYRAATRRVAFFDDLQRAVVAVSGVGALRVINGLASNDVMPVPEGRGVYSFLLDRRGRVVAELRILPPPGHDHAAGDTEVETVWLDSPDTALPALTAHLRKYVPPMLARHRVTSVAVYTFIGPLAAEALASWAGEAGAVFLRPPGRLAALEATTVRRGDLEALAVRREDMEGAGFDLYVDHPGGAGGAEDFRRELEGAVTGAGGSRGVRADWEVLRVERGLPVFGSELGEARLAQEAGQDDRAISFAKGCFTGQEVVARIHYRGHVNRHLRGFRWSADAFAPTVDMSGNDLRAPSGTDAAKPIGVITSAVHSPTFGPIGLGYTRREIGIGAVLEPITHPGVALHVTGLPFTHA